MFICVHPYSYPELCVSFAPLRLRGSQVPGLGLISMRSLVSNLAIAKNWPVLGAVLLLSLAGYVSIRAHDPAEANRQLVFLGISIVVLSMLQLVNYREIGRYSWGLYLASVLLLIYTVIGAWYGNRNPNSSAHLPLVPKVKGAYAWIDLGVTRFEPSEITKIAFVMVLARYLRFRSNYRTLWGLVPPFVRLARAGGL